MTAEERIKKINHAQALIEEVRDSLSAENINCECCGLTKYTNFDQYQVREWLNAAITRLSKTSERIVKDKHLFKE
jgi:hypothetical protein